MVSHMNLEYSTSGSLKPYLIKAIFFHVAVVLLILILNYTMGLNLFDMKDSSRKVEIIQSAVRVDVVGMPKLTVKELKEAVVETSVKGEEKEVQGKEETSDESSSFSSFLNQYSQKKIDLPRAKKKGSEVGIDSKKIKSLVLEGNKVSQGTSLIGDSLKQEMTAYNNYVGNLPNIVRPYWKLPTYLMDQNLKCRVRVYISQSGAVTRTEVYESSGVSEFDDRALRAVKAVGAFPVPPAEIATRLVAGDVILGFPL